MDQFEQTDIFLEPPLYFAQDHIFDINFHPTQDVLACALVSGHVKLLQFNQEEVKEIASFHHHEVSARISQFNPTGQTLLTASKDGSFALLDYNGQIIMKQEKALKEAINASKFLNDNLIALGDDSGKIKIWDVRSNDCVYQVKEAEESITAFDLDSSENFLLSTSLDGYLSVFDLRVNCTAKTALNAMSDCMEEDLTGLCILNGGKFVCVSTSEGNLLLFKWDYFGDFKDRVVGHPNQIDALLKIDENTIMTGGEDGLLRGVSVFPNKILGILGQHEEDQQFPITKIDIDRTKRIVASISHDNSIKFHDVTEFIGKRGLAKHSEPNEEKFSNNQGQKSNKQEQQEDNDNASEEEMSSEASMSSDEEVNKKKTTQLRVKNVVQSKQNQKKEKLKQFYQDM